MPDIQKQKAEEVRLRALYRRLAMRANRDSGSFSRLPVSALKGLVGPDCAYHLYGSVPSPSGDKREK
ncbi:MAG: hypothetical protein KAR83_03070 [Thermodesulfovibrionales bacterium]|nr:hypothetical protein [Thermodesulfovibrionales bacterium]